MEPLGHSNGGKESSHNTLYHPLGPLTAAEYAKTAAILQASWTGDTSLHFKSMVLLEPPKAELIAYLDAERNGHHPAPLARRAYVAYYIRNTVGHLCYDSNVCYC